jgi:hypothetical protein
LFLSIAKYRAPNGDIIQDNAVTPNVVVAANNGFGLVAPATTGTVTKPTAPGAAHPTQPAKPPAAQPDNQLNKALDLLKQEKAA